MKKAAIITRNYELESFIVPELEMLGYRVTVLSTVTSTHEKFDFVIIDVDTVTEGISDISFPIVTVSEKYATEITANGCTLSWPCRISDVFTLDAVFSTADVIRDQKEQKNEDTVRIINGNTVVINNHYAKLSNHEMVLLKELCHANGEIVSREQIMKLLNADDGNISDVYVCHLRRKLDSQLGKKLIITERGRGYRTTLKLSE